MAGISWAQQEFLLDNKNVFSIQCDRAQWMTLSAVRKAVIAGKGDGLGCPRRRNRREVTHVQLHPDAPGFKCFFMSPVEISRRLQ